MCTKHNNNQSTAHSSVTNLLRDFGLNCCLIYYTSNISRKKNTLLRIVDVITSFVCVCVSIWSDRESLVAWTFCRHAQKLTDHWRLNHFRSEAILWLFFCYFFLLLLLSAVVSLQNVYFRLNQQLNSDIKWKKGRHANNKQQNVDRFFVNSICARDRQRERERIS